MAASARVRRRNTLVLLCALAALGIVFAYKWRKEIRDELLLLLQPGYRVLEVNSADGLMTVEGVSEDFVVRCQDLCRSFVVGGKYPMLYRGDSLEFRHKGAFREFEIVEIRVKPPTVPGGMG
jgi:hypothetical protein